MARAKRTDRADARRRYRATQAEVPDVDAEDSDESDEPATAAPAKSGGSANAGSSRARPMGSRQQQNRDTNPPIFASGQRPSFTASFRAAARPFNVRSDIASIPDMALHSHAVWLPAAAAVASGGLFLASQPLGSNGIANLLFQLFVLPPTIAGSFLAGILAKRATYIAGGIAALVGALVFTIAVFITPVNVTTAIAPGASPSPSPGSSAALSDTSAAPSAAASASAGTSPSAAESPSPSPSASPAPAVALSDSDKFSAALQSVLISVPFGIAIGAFGGYYKRFLYVSNPARQRRELEKQRQKGQRQQPPKKRF